MASTIVIAHVATALAAVPLGAVVLFRRKGGTTHRVLGRLAGGLMFATAALSLFITGLNGDRWSPIHILSFAMLFGMPVAVRAARRGAVRAHRAAMLQMYAGLLLAGLLALLPDRLLGAWLWNGL